MSPLWGDWRRARSSLRGADGLLLLLDFDGTLSPLVDVPGRARLSAGLRGLLERLNGHPRVHVAVISGRDLKDVSRRVGVKSLYYGGNHGLEMRGPGFSFQHPGAFLQRPRLRKLAVSCRRFFRGVRGVLVEDKGLSVAVHQRRVPPGALEGFGRALARARRSAEGKGLLWRAGRQVWEALPRVSWNKGAAAALLRRELGGPFPVAVGDDLTDEDMFKAFGKTGLTVCVAAGARRTRARYTLPSQADVPLLLERIESLVREADHDRTKKK